MTTSSIESPEFGDFRPVNTPEIFGVPYVHLREPAGMTMLMTAAGVERLDGDTDFRALLERTVSFIATHGKYGDAVAVKEHEPSAILRVGSLEPNEYKVARPIHEASVYVPEADLTTIIKAYDYNPKAEAPVQFYMGALIARTATEHVGGPNPLALITSPAGHQTTLTERLDRQSMEWHLHDMDTRRESAAADSIEARVGELVCQHLKRTVFPASLWLHTILPVFDVRNSNILPDRKPSLGSLDDIHFAIIDQPRPRGTKLVLAMRRRMLLRHKS